MPDQMMMTAADVERRARELGLSMREVFHRAGVHISIWTRWKSGDTEPIARNYRRIVGVLQAEAPAGDTKPKPKKRAAA